MSPRESPVKSQVPGATRQDPLPLRRTKRVRHIMWSPARNRGLDMWGVWRDGLSPQIFLPEGNLALDPDRFQECLVMADHQQGAVEVRQGTLQLFDRIDVEMVGRLIEYQQLGDGGP